MRRLTVIYLSGIARCGVCGHVVHAARNRQTEAYRCKGRGCVARNRNDSDAYVTEVVLLYLEGQDVAKLLAVGGKAAELNALRETVEQLRVRLDLAADDYADGRIDSRQLTRISAKLRPQIHMAENRAAQRTSDSAVAAIVAGGEIRAAWDAAPLTTRRAVVASLVRVTIMRARQGARVFDPNTVQIEWIDP